jgi:hypothetical protein
MRTAARTWAAVAGQTQAPIPWALFDCSILGILLSGPPLFLSWIGNLLATRCAARLPRRRFRAMTGSLSFGFACAALAICLTPWPFEDEREVALDVEVVDDVTGRPIAAAFVRLTDPFFHDPNPISPRAFTDTEGHARLGGRFTARGQRNAFQAMGVYSPWGRWLEVSAANHRTRRVPLPELLGSDVDLACSPVAKVRLARGRTPKDAFGGVAGLYSAGGGFGGRWFEIAPDGRFAWCEWGCTHSSEEYGYLNLNDGDIELVPIPHPGREIDPLVTSRYRVIEWGNRHYLSIADERALQEFCRKALMPNRPSRTDDSYGSYLRISDGDTTQTGLPRLPAKVWVKFLKDEMSLKNEQSTLRLALDALMPGTGRR